eukprot:m.31547 g.31547  ORF g.31547 m.31547 type:complete len:411 (-) comp9430_c0_seq1:290-1522(-)
MCCGVEDTADLLLMLGFALLFLFVLNVLLTHFTQPHISLELSKRATGVVTDMVAACTALHDFDGSPWHLFDVAGVLSTSLPHLYREFHFDTTIDRIVARKTRQRSGTSVRGVFERELLTMSDGGTIGLDWSLATTTESERKQALVLILHGLCGESLSRYVVHTVESANASGYDTVTLVARGCGGVRLTTSYGFHAAHTGDIEECLVHLQSLFPTRPIYAVGFSLGAGQLALYLGKAGQKSRVSAAVCISPSWDFRLKEPTFPVWSRFKLSADAKKFAASNMAELEQNSKFDPEAVLGARTLIEFDATAVVPVFGFRDVREYHTQSSACRLANNIFVPTLAISALDDPICSALGCPSDQDPAQADMGPGLVVAKTRTGGHVAFSEGLLPTTKTWMERIIVGWFDAYRAVNA